ncbi:MAG: glycosyl hydrolase [Candidatus Eisenbacteria bacterium]|uniref:Glycosyl hydrolase n=1 Tax=Eiseniibacteriota bacterium TaxID=2212470 RepID=A0A7Y2E862_UNCEI|nr:glycosyl hydrolase [Candidatus Eisenbacteria bacterium]
MNQPKCLISIFTVALLSSTLSCAGASGPGGLKTSEILLTSERGDRLSPMENVTFKTGTPSGPVITVFPDRTKQTIEGIGSSFTESSAFVLAHLEPAKRKEVMEKIYGESGANFTLTRTHIGSCDFSVEGKYSYASTPGDKELKDFSIAPDLEGFDPAKYPGIKDASYDLLPMIQEALSIKNAQRDKDLKIIASAWTAPDWMKDIETWYIPGSEENNWQGDAGRLKPEYVATYADYTLKYLDAYAEAGVDLWGLTPVNEPHGNGGHWESMHFTPESQLEFVNEHLGPRLQNSQHADDRLLVFDQNRDGLEEWTDVIFGDPKSADYVFGVAVHWYASTFKVYEDTFDRVKEKFPDYAIIHTEGCIDNLGNPAGGGIEDPEGYQETGWFKNDAFWWNQTATDWAYSASWAGPGVADHPMYTPVHRYARNIIVSLDHWVAGWVDWNIVLDAQGGPNHANNFCGAPIMIDTENQDIYYTPIYDVLAQFSRTIRPGDKAVQTQQELAGLDPDALHACATINDAGLLAVQLLNTTQEAIEYNLQIADGYATITLPPNSVQTVRVQL